MSKDLQKSLGVRVGVFVSQRLCECLANDLVHGAPI